MPGKCTKLPESFLSPLALFNHCPFWNPLQNPSPHIAGWKIPQKKIIQPKKTCHKLQSSHLPSKMQISTSAWPLKPGKKKQNSPANSWQRWPKRKWIKKNLESSSPTSFSAVNTLMVVESIPHKKKKKKKLHFMMDLYKTSQTKPIFEATVYHVFLRIMVTPLFG